MQKRNLGPLFVAWFLLCVGCGGDNSEPAAEQNHPQADTNTVPDSPETAPAESQKPAMDTPTADQATKPSDDSPGVDKEPTTASDYRPVEADFPKDKPVKRWIAALVDDDPKQRGVASDQIDQLGPDGITFLLAAIHDDDPAVRAGAAFGVLARLNVFDKRMSKALVAALDDPSPRVRAIAMRGVGSLDADSAALAVPALARIVSSTDVASSVRSQAARTLALVGPDARSLAALSLALKSGGDREVRLACIRAIPRVAPSPEDSVKALAPVLSGDSDLDCRRLVVVSLAKFGPAATPAAPELVAALRDEPRVRTAAVSALAAIGEPALAPLIAGLDTDNVEAQQAAVTALGLIGPPAKDAADKLRQLAESGDPKVRQAATAALARMGATP